MAQTPEGRRLTEAHRQAQQDVRDDFIAEFMALWALLDTQRLDDTGPGWVRAVMRLVATYRLLSAQVAARYFWEFSAVEAPSTPTRRRIEWDEPSRPSSPRPGSSTRPRRTPTDSKSTRRRRDGLQGRRPRPDVIPEPRQSGLRWDIDEDAIRRSLERPGTRIEIPDIDWTPRDRAVEVSLNVTGPIGQKSKIGRGKSPRVARDESFVESAGAASRHVLTGGRQSLLTLMRDNMPQPRWIRVTDGDPCSFCAMLASRGPVYLTQQSAGFEAHDHCACTAEPVYYSDSPWPGRAQEFHRLWNEHIARRYSGEEARREWRRIYERLQREARRADIA